MPTTKGTVMKSIMIVCFKWIIPFFALFDAIDYGKVTKKKYFLPVTFLIRLRLTEYHGTERRNTIHSTDTERGHRSFSVFLDRYSRPLYVLIVQIVGCPEDAEELVQDVFLKAFRCLDSYKGECRFSTWLYRIAYNAAVSATRKRNRNFFILRKVP